MNNSLQFFNIHCYISLSKYILLYCIKSYIISHRLFSKITLLVIENLAKLKNQQNNNILIFNTRKNFLMLYIFRRISQFLRKRSLLRNHMLKTNIENNLIII